MLKRIFLAAALTFLPLAAFADFTGKDASGNTVTIGAFTLSGGGGVTVQLPKHALVDPSTGNAIGVSASPLYVQIPGTVPSSTSDGSDATQGAKADTAYAGSGSASVVSLLKGIYGGLYAPLPTGQNLIGKTDSVIQGTATPRGGTIATESKSQQFAAANASRRGLVVQNQSSGDLYINCSGAATLDFNSLKIPAGLLYDTPAHHAGTAACNIIGTTAGAAFYAREF